MPKTRMKPSGAYRDRTGDLRLANSVLGGSGVVIACRCAAAMRLGAIACVTRHRRWSPWSDTNLTRTGAQARGRRPARRSRYSGSRTFTGNDLNQVLAKIADREPDLRLAA